ncbi:hypothetical protein ACMSW4_000695, partial [Cronobacter sakazakii]
PLQSRLPAPGGKSASWADFFLAGAKPSPPAFIPGYREMVGALRLPTLQKRDWLSPWWVRYAYPSYKNVIGYSYGGCATLTHPTKT